MSNKIKALLLSLLISTPAFAGRPNWQYLYTNKLSSKVYYYHVRDVKIETVYFPVYRLVETYLNDSKMYELMIDCYVWTYVNFEEETNVWRQALPETVPDRLMLKVCPKEK